MKVNQPVTKKCLLKKNNLVGTSETIRPLSSKTFSDLNYIEING